MIAPHISRMKDFQSQQIDKLGPFLGSLPMDILRKIFVLVDVEDLKKAERTSKKFRELSQAFASLSFLRQNLHAVQKLPFDGAQAQDEKCITARTIWIHPFTGTIVAIGTQRRQAWTGPVSQCPWKKETPIKDRFSLLKSYPSLQVQIQMEDLQISERAVTILQENSEDDSFKVYKIFAENLNSIAHSINQKIAKKNCGSQKNIRWFRKFQKETDLAGCITALQLNGLQSLPIKAA